MRFWIAAFAACGVLVVIAGCGGEGSADSGGSGENSAGIPVESPEEAKERGVPTDLKVPPIPPPTKLVVEDLIEGTGEEAEKGDLVTLRYYAKTWDGGVYSNAWRYKPPPTFRLGAGPVLGAAAMAPGFDKSIRGMKEGGRREVIVPISEQRWPVEEKNRLPLRPGDTWVAIVDLLKVE
jgi:peptidylprolyl isomerase